MRKEIYGKMDTAQIFQAVQIQTIELCNRDCYFCPSRLKSRISYGIMEKDTFYRIADQLQEMNYKGRISPYLMNECLMDDRIYRFISHLRSKFPDNIILINTNGDRLFEEGFFEELVATATDVIQINCYDNQKRYEEMLSFFEEKQRKNKNILIHDEHTKLIKMSERNGAVNLRIKRIFKAPHYFWNRGGNIPKIAPVNKYNSLHSCKFPSTQFYINYCGDSILCCSDWKYEVVFGNINEQNIMDIWNSDLYRQYKEMHKIGWGKLLPLCNRCNRIIFPQDQAKMSRKLNYTFLEYLEESINESKFRK